MDKAIKKEAYTHAGKLSVNASEKGGRIVRSSMSSISYARDFVNSDFMKNNEKKEEFSNKLREFFYIGDKYVFDSGDECDKKARKVIRMKRFKRILACAFIAFCATVVLLCSGVIAWVFVNGGSI